MNAEGYAILVSLALLTLALAILAARAFLQFLATASRPQLAWGGGLALSSAAMAVEVVVYAGFVDSPLLEFYLFLTAALVGVLSLGATRVLRSPRFETAYGLYMVGASAVLAGFCFTTPLSPSAMVSAGVISGNPPLTLDLISTLVTGPATVVLLASSAFSFKRTWKWQNLLMIAGALILAAGGTLYILTFPAFLYYAEFIGIVLLFFGLISMPKVSLPATATSGAGTA